MKISLLATAKSDLKSGFSFYERQQPGLGKYFLSSLQADIDSLKFFAGIHPVYANAVYYQINNETVQVFAVLDCRINPKTTTDRLK